MKTRLLMPNKFKRIGFFIFSITTIIFLSYLKFEWQPQALKYTYQKGDVIMEVNLLKEIIFTSWIAGLIMMAFSKEKREDEYISFSRLSSWHYSIITSLIISIVGTWTIFGVNYLSFSALNMLTAPLAFTIIFNISIYISSRNTSVNEK